MEAPLIPKSHTKEACIRRLEQHTKQVMADSYNKYFVTEGQSDLISAPPHYTQYKIEPVDFIMKNKLEFWQGNIIKYIMRFEKKNGVEDLKKARTYLNRKISELETSSD